MGASTPASRCSTRCEREVAEETGLDVTTGRLLYVSERVKSVGVHDLELVFLAQPGGVPNLKGVRAIDPSAPERHLVRPAILDHITRDAASDWRYTPRWLGNLESPMPVVR